jgi:hypothetical protein
MSRLEEDLKQALQCEEPSPQFTERVMARISEIPKRQGGWFGLSIFRPRVLQWATACLVLLVTISIGGVRYREYQQEKHQGEAAKAQVLLALQIASNKIHTAQRLVHEKRTAPVSQKTREQE